MSKLGATAGGAASGAATGAVAGPWGAAIGGVAGGLLGYFSDNSDQVDNSQRDKLEADRKAAADYLSYRDTLSGAHQQAMANQQGYFDVNSNMLNSMNGGQGTPDSPGSYTSVIDPSKTSTNTTPHPTGPMPEGNAPRPLSFMPGGR